MATEHDRPTPDGFGRVNRVKGIVFEVLTLAASVAGILALGVLLAYVAWDAFGLETAEPAWYGLFGAVVVLPIVAFVVYARRRPIAGTVALEILSTAMAGLLAGFGAVAVLELIAGDELWFVYFASTLGPLGALFVYDRLVPRANWVGLGYVAVVLIGPIVGTVLGPGIGPLRFPILIAVAAGLGAPLVYLLSVVIPAAVVTRYVVGTVLELGNGTVAGAAVIVLAVVAIPLVDAISALSRSVWLLFLVTLVVPLSVVSWRNLAVPERRTGFAGPLALVAGLVALAVLPEVMGVAGPSPWFDWQYVTSNPSRFADEAGLFPAIVGSVFIIVIVAITTLVVAIGAAIYLEEFAPSAGLGGRIARLIRINISNLAGVPSVVYGILGLAVFAQGIGLGVGTVITAAFTLSLLILPIVIIAAREAIDAVPDAIREASYGMGATRWQTVRNVVLPQAIPGTLTGTILALGRAIGETAPLIMVGVATTTFQAPDGLFSRTSAMPMQIFTWATYPSREFQHGVVAAGVVTLLIVLLTMNSIAILLRNEFEKEGY